MLRDSPFFSYTITIIGLILFNFSVSFGRVTFSRIATRVAMTTGDFPKIVVTHVGNADREADACDTPIPRAAARPTIEVLR